MVECSVFASLILVGNRCDILYTRKKPTGIQPHTVCHTVEDEEHIVTYITL